MATNITFTANNESTEYSVAIGSRGPTGAAGPNSVTTSTSSNLTGFIAANGTAVSGATAGDTAATPNTIVLRDASGGSSFAAVDATSVTSSGDDAYISTSGDDAYIYTEGDDAYIFTGGDEAYIYTVGYQAHIFTSGSDANIYTVGANAHIQSRSTFKLFNGTHTTTLSHTPTANRAIAFPDDDGTVALDDDPRFTDARTPLAHTHSVSDIVSVTSERLLGRHAGGSGAAQEVTVGNGLEFSGSGIRREALTGDITASAGSNSTTLAGTIAGNKTFSGDLSFTSTTRPTSAGTGTPAATSLITRADGDARYSQVVGASLTAGVDSDVNTTTYKTVSELSFALEIGTYFIDAVLVHNGNASYATAGVKDRLNFTGTATASGSVYRIIDNATISNSVPNARLSANTLIESAPSNRSQTTWRKGVLTVTVAGTLSVEIAQTVAVAAANTTLAAGSHLIVTRLI